MTAFEGSAVFPGTTHEWQIFVPEQYDAAKPACATVFFDGSGFAKLDDATRVPVVFDNLIAKKDMPVNIGCLSIREALLLRNRERRIGVIAALSTTRWETLMRGSFSTS